MKWWHDALYDTCSLITLDKILLDHPKVASLFPGVHAVEESFTEDQLQSEIADRMRPRCKLLDPPKASGLTIADFMDSRLKRLTSVDGVVFLTAMHHQCPLVTGDKRIAKVAQSAHLKVGNMALILQTLVRNQDLSIPQCNQILSDLLERKDSILPATHPQDWTTLKDHRFP